MYSRCPQVGEPSLQPPPTPKFALAPLWMMKPPPVRKSHGQANAEPLASNSASVANRVATRVNPLRMVIPPGLLNCRDRRPDDHIGDAANDHMKSVHDDAGRRSVLLVDHHLASRDGDRLVRDPADPNRHSIERKITDDRGAGAPAAQDRRGLRHEKIRADCVAG